MPLHSMLQSRVAKNYVAKYGLEVMIAVSPLLEPACIFLQTKTEICDTGCHRTG